MLKLFLATVLPVASAILSADNINQRVVEAEYAVRGPLLELAKELSEQLKDEDNDLPFDELYFCNIGNPQALGQKPLSFNREVLSLVQMPSLLEEENIGQLFSEEAISRAKEYLAAIRNGVGAYSDSQGYKVVREEVAEFITARDGEDLPAANAADIFLTDGASAGIKSLLQVAIRSDRKDGLMVPIPQYPLYSALASLGGASLVGYYLDEDSRWATRVDALQDSIDKAKADGVEVRAMVVINPGNPTGQCLTPERQQAIIRFCIREGLVLLADEVYQENVYAEDREFHSFRKVALSMGQEAADLQLVSFHSTSKGFIGECGLRGGYYHLHNIPTDVVAQLTKLASIFLCSNTVGQLSVGLMVNPPEVGTPAGDKYIGERETILASLRRRATALSAGLNKLEGITCNDAEGAMYVFPQIRLPAGAIAAAAAAGIAPDAFYCISVLRNTGIVMVPGSGFKQVDGTYHFRTTILPPEDKLNSVVERLSAYHQTFMAQYQTDAKGEL